MFTSSIEPDAAEGVKKQYELILRYFERENKGVFTASDEEKANQSEEFLKKMEEFGASL